MNILSISLHIEHKVLPRWEDLVEKSFPILLKNIENIDNFIFSSVESHFVDEGKNYNLLLFFSERKQRDGLYQNGIAALEKLIRDNFKEQEVMIFQTSIDPIFSSL